MGAALAAFLASLLKWPDGVVVKVGNELRTGGEASSGAGLLCDDEGRLLFDDGGNYLTDGT